jgi:anti-sigma factor RsiW
MNHESIFRQIPDYVLDLLPDSKRNQVEKHAAACPECRQAILRQSQIGQAVRSTLGVVTQPPTGRLGQLMPTARAQRSFFSFGFIWQKQMASLCLFIVLLLGSLSLPLAKQRQAWNGPSPTLLAVTATMTEEPTATVAIIKMTRTIAPTNTAIAATSSHNAATITPALVATPVAAALSLASN